MIPDFVKLVFEDPTDSLLSHPLLNWNIYILEETGQVKTDKFNRIWRTAKYGSLTFYRIESTNKTIYRIEGSLHKHAFKGSNATDCSFGAFVKTVEDIVRLFNINPRTCFINPFEFGVNLQLPFSVDNVLSALMNCRGREYSKKSDYNERRFEFHQFVLKIYDKGAMFGATNNILRLEVQLKKMQFLKTRGLRIQTLADLLKRETVEQLGAILLSVWNDVVVQEVDLYNGYLTKRELEFVSRYSNAKEWSIINGSERQEIKKRYRFIVQNRLGETGLHNTIARFLQNKQVQLLNGNPPYLTSTKLTSSSYKFPPE